VELEPCFLCLVEPLASEIPLLLCMKSPVNLCLIEAGGVGPTAAVVGGGLVPGESIESGDCGSPSWIKNECGGDGGVTSLPGWGGLETTEADPLLLVLILTLLSLSKSLGGNVGDVGVISRYRAVRGSTSMAAAGGCAAYVGDDDDGDLEGRESFTDGCR
jgi:hypothetical protein